MTASPQPESKSPTSRRALLAGALGGIGALAASAIGRASPVRAGSDGDVVLGADNTATTTTSITNSSNANSVLFCSSNTGAAIQCSSNTGGFGVYSTAYAGTGVFGSSGAHIGVLGVSSALNQPGSAGQSFTNSTGLLGYSGGSLGSVVIPAKTGVYGYANQDASARGIYGESSKGVAGYFKGSVYVDRFLEMPERATGPSAPAPNRLRLFARDNGSGKTQLCVRFPTGAVQVIKTEA
jgi:hypothetical protein